MQLYIVTNTSDVQKHLEYALSMHTPKHHSALLPLPQRECLLFVHDLLLETLSETDLKALFALHVMVLSITPSFEKARYYLSLGAKGYGNAHMHASHLLYAYETIVEGNIWLYPEYISRLITGLVSSNEQSHCLEILSHREKDVARLLAKGDSHKEIAQTLDITVRTVKAHATAIYHKLNIKDRLSLALLLH